MDVECINIHFDGKYQFGIYRKKNYISKVQALYCIKSSKTPRQQKSKKGTLEEFCMFTQKETEKSTAFRMGKL